MRHQDENEQTDAEKTRPEPTTPKTGLTRLINTAAPVLPPLPRLAYSLRENSRDILGVSYISCFRLCQRGLLKSSSALRTKLISHVEIERFLKESTMITSA